MFIKQKKFNSSVLLFIIIAIFYLIGNLLWFKINTPIIPENISATHFLDIFKNQIFYFNAPVLTWIMKGMFVVFGVEYFDLQIIFVNYIFFLIALYFMYKLGTEFRDQKTGNISMLLFALVPAIYGMSRQYGHQDWHVMVAMIVNIYCLIRANDFKDRKWSILYGVSVGLGLLVKDEFLAYFFTPWLYVVIRSLINKIERQKITNIITTILIGSLIAGCHYFRFEIISKIIKEPNKEIISSYISTGFKVMTVNFVDSLISISIAILFIVGLLYVLFIYKNRNKWILFIWIIVPWLIIVFMPHHKEVEYGVGFLPAFILCSAIFIKSKIINYKNIVLYLVIIICLEQYLFVSYDINKLKIFNFNRITKCKEISYDTINNNFYLKIINVCTKYKNKTFFVWDFFLKYSSSIKLLLDLYNIKNIYDCNFSNSIKTDVIFFYEELLSSDEIVQMYIDDVLSHGSDEVFAYLLTEKGKNKEKNKLDDVLKTIKKEYFVEHVFNNMVMYVKYEKNN